MWNKTRMKETGENILKRAGHEQHTSDRRGTGWGINPMEKAAADLLKKQKSKLWWSFAGNIQLFILDNAEFRAAGGKSLPKQIPFL